MACFIASAKSTASKQPVRRKMASKNRFINVSQMSKYDKSFDLLRNPGVNAVNFVDINAKTSLKVINKSSKRIQKSLKTNLKSSKLCLQSTPSQEIKKTDFLINSLFLSKNKKIPDKDEISENDGLFLQKKISDTKKILKEKAEFTCFCSRSS